MFLLAFAGMGLAQDVYSSGYYYASSGECHSVVYKNGVIWYQSSGSSSRRHTSDALAFDPENNAIYWVDNATETSSGDYTYGDVFKNGARYLNNTTGTHINDIEWYADSNIPLYSVGCKKGPNTQRYYVCVWNGSSTTPLYQPGFDLGYASEAYGVKVLKNGSNIMVYYCGYENDSEGGSPRATLWVNNTKAITLSDVDSRAYHIDYYDNKFYIIGEEFNGSDYAPKEWIVSYWGGTYSMETSSTGTPTLSKRLNHIKLDCADVYVTGYQYGVHATLWKNGEIIKSFENASGQFIGIDANSKGVYYTYSKVNGDNYIYRNDELLYTINSCSAQLDLCLGPEECEDASIRTLPYFEGFETGATDWVCWTVVDEHQNDYSYYLGQESYWQRRGETQEYTYNYTIPTGEYCAFHDYNIEHAQEGWLISPKLFLQPDRTSVQLTFKSREQYNNDYTYEGVLVSTYGTPNISHFTQVWDQGQPSDTWTTVTIDLSDYMGQAIYIGFKYTGQNGHAWYIDDVNVTESWSPCSPISTLPFSESFNSEPFQCWYNLDLDHSGENKCWKYDSSNHWMYHPWGQADVLQEGYFFSPKITLPANSDYVLKFNTRTSSYGSDMSNKVWIATDEVGVPDPNSGFYTQVWSDTEFSSEWKQVSIPLSGYAGHDITVGFNYSGTQAHYWYIDDFSVEVRTYTITATANPTSGGSVTGGGIFTLGQSCTLSATPNSGYAFVNWTKNGEVVSTNASYTFDVTDDGDYVANFVSIYNITVSASPAEGGTVSGGGTYQNGQSCTLTATANAGYTFSAWTKNGVEVSTNPSYTFTVTESAAYVAVFLQEIYSITASASPAEGGTVSGGGNFFYGQSCTLTSTPSTGYTFSSWTKNGVEVSTNPSYTFTVTESAAYVAVFLQNMYTITATANPSEGGSVNGAGSYLHGQECTLMATPSTGYNFVNWTKNGTEVSTSGAYTFTVTESAAYVANFEPIIYTILASANPSAGVSVSGEGNYDYGQSCTLTATPNAGYAFINWTKNGTVMSNSAEYTFTVTGAGAYVANFSQNSYSITATADPAAGGTVSGAGNYVYGQSCTLTATPNAGYAFVNWTKGSSVVSSEASYTFTVTEAGSYVAHFSQNNYSITASADPAAGGTVSGGGNFTYGQSCTLTATPNTGYAFVNWTLGGEVVSSSPTYTFTVTASGAYVAHFSQNSYTITASADPAAGGTVSGAGNYTHGQSCTLTATPNTGYAFVNWTKGSSVVSNSPTYSFTVSEAGSYVAHFNQNSYTITASADPAAGGTVSGAGTYNHGQSCTLIATPNTDYAFVNWTKDGVEVSTNASYTFTVTASGAYVAHFTLTSSTITQSTHFVNGWTWWSAYIEEDGGSCLTQLENGLGASGQVIKNQSASHTHIGNGWYGGFTSLDNAQTYRVKTNAAVDVDITGPAVATASHPVTLKPNWTWIGYPCTSSMSVATALAGITPTVGDVLKSQTSSTVYMGSMWAGALNTITPGMGLMYYSKKSTNMTLVYPTGAKGEETKPNLTAENNNWQPNTASYPDNMTVLAVVEMDGEELAPELVPEPVEGPAQETGKTYELAAFANGECRGSVQLLYIEPLNRYMAILTVAGDTETELRFGLYDMTTGEEYFNTSETLTYQTNAIIGSPDAPLVVRFRGNTGLNDLDRLVQVYPNPVDKGQTFNIGMTDMETGEAQVEIINALGVVVETRRATSLQAPNVPGVYTLRITVEGQGICYRKLIVR